MLLKQIVKIHGSHCQGKIIFPDQITIFQDKLYNHFYLNFNQHGISRLCIGTFFSSIIEVFFYRHNIYSLAFFSKWTYSQAILFQGHFLIL